MKINDKTRKVKVGEMRYEELTDLEIMELAIIDWEDRAEKRLNSAQVQFNSFIYLGEDCYRESWESNCVLCEMFSCRDIEKPYCPMYGKWGDDIVTCLDSRSPYKEWAHSDSLDKTTAATILLNRLKAVHAEMKEGNKKGKRIIPTPLPLFAYYEENDYFYNVVIKGVKIYDYQTEEEINPKGKTFYYGWK